MVATETRAQNAKLNCRIYGSCSLWECAHNWDTWGSCACRFDPDPSGSDLKQVLDERAPLIGTPVGGAPFEPQTIIDQNMASESNPIVLATATNTAGDTFAIGRRYKTAFRAWPAGTMLRNADASLAVIDAGAAFHYPARLFPPANHPLVEARGASAVRAILTNAFLCFADGQMVLEREAVNPVAALMARADTEIRIPLKMRMDASKLYADEGVHAIYAQEQYASVCATQGAEWIYLGMPLCFSRLQNAVARVELRHRHLLEMLFAAVVETLISDHISEIPKDPSVLPPIREFVKLHATDEHRHHALFAQFIPLLWERIGRAQQEFVGQYIPTFIRWFLDPDIRNLDMVLVSQGFSVREAEAIIVESFSDDATNASMRQTAAKTISYFRRAGALNIPAVSDAFEASALL